jgi:hypothetical protein
MGNFLNNFMIGKKKYSSAVVLPIIIALVNVFILDPVTREHTTNLLSEFMPTMIALVGGVSYAIIEGINDNTKIKAGCTAGAGPVLTPIITPQVMAQVAAGNPQGEASGSAQPQLQNSAAWDMKAFDEKVKQKAPITYGVLNSSTEFNQALLSGQDAPANNIADLMAYWDYVQMKADMRFSEVWGYSFREAVDKVSEPGCPTCPTTCGSFSNLKHKALALGEKYYTSYLDYERTRQRNWDTQALAEVAARGFDWKGRLAPIYQNLYFAGEMASYLVQAASTQLSNK